MDSISDDIQKLQSAIYEDSTKENFTIINEASCEGESRDGFPTENQDRRISQEDVSFSIFEEIPPDLREDDRDQLIIDDMEPSLENALVLNKAYQTVLLELLQKLEVLKVVNQNRQKTIAAEIEELENAIVLYKKSSHERKKKIPFTFFGIPYFKDNNFSCPPKNEDTLLAEKIGFKSVVAIPQPKLFSKYELRRLKAGLKEQTLTIQATILMKRRTELQGQLKQMDSSSMSESDRKKIAKDLETVQRQIYEVSEWPEEKLLDVDPEKVDWQKISLVNFERSRTPDQLKLYFSQYLHPKVNNNRWTPGENRRLKELAKQYKNGIDWDELAEKLNTGRTPYECFRMYQERFNPKHRKFGWDLQDNKKLLNLLSQYGNKSTRQIDWDGLRDHFPGRSKSQLYTYYLLSAGESFTHVEDALILEGVKAGYDMADIVLLMGKRTIQEVRIRYKALQSKATKSLASDKPWTEAEDNFLLNIPDVDAFLTRRYQFRGRTNAQLYSRFHFLRMKKTTPKKYVEELKAKVLEREMANEKHRLKGPYRRNLGGVVAYPSSQSNDELPIRQAVIPKLKRKLVDLQMQAELAKDLLPGRNYTNRPSQQKTIGKLLKELKEIVRPFMVVYTKRVRTISYPGDGRECGIVLACLYRILQGNFTLAPKEGITAEKMEEFGVDEHVYLAYESFISLIKDLEPPNFTAAEGQVICLPPTLTTLAGFRGLLLHRKYLITSAKQEYTSRPTSEARVVEIENTDARPGSSSQGDNAVTDMCVDSTDEPGIEASTNPQVQQELPTTAPEPNGALNNGCQIPSQENENTTNAVNDEQVSDETQPTNQGASHAVMEILPDSAPESGVFLLEPDESMLDEAQDFFNYQTSDEGSESDEEMEEEMEEEVHFGNKEADALLLSRMLSLFYWPGIMSTINITEDMRRAAEQETPEPEPEQDPINPKVRRSLLRKKRREHIQAVVRRRYNKPDPPPENTQEEASTSTEAPPSKRKKREKKGADPNAINRVTRSRGKSAEGS